MYHLYIYIIYNLCIHTHPLTQTYTIQDQRLSVNMCSVSISCVIDGGHGGDDNDDNI